MKTLIDIYPYIVSKFVFRELFKISNDVSIDIAMTRRLMQSTLCINLDGDRYIYPLNREVFPKKMANHIVRDIMAEKNIGGCYVGGW